MKQFCDTDWTTFFPEDKTGVSARLSPSSGLPRQISPNLPCRPGRICFCLSSPHRVSFPPHGSPSYQSTPLGAPDRIRTWFSDVRRAVSRPLEDEGRIPPVQEDAGGQDGARTSPTVRTQQGAGE